MKIILLEDVKSLGKKGDIVNVSDGYARNAILPNQHADKVAAENLENARQLASVIEKTTVQVKLKGGEGGKSFGSISAKEISQAAKDQAGLDIDKKKMHLKENLRNLGRYEVPVKLHPQVTANLTVQVIEE